MKKVIINNQEFNLNGGYNFNIKEVLDHYLIKFYSMYVLNFNLQSKVLKGDYKIIE